MGIFYRLPALGRSRSRASRLPDGHLAGDWFGEAHAGTFLCGRPTRGNCSIACEALFPLFPFPLFFFSILFFSFLFLSHGGWL